MLVLSTVVGPCTGVPRIARWAGPRQGSLPPRRLPIWELIDLISSFPALTPEFAFIIHQFFLSKSHLDFGLKISDTQNLPFTVVRSLSLPEAPLVRRFTLTIQRIALGHYL